MSGTTDGLIPRSDLERLFRVGLALGSERQRGRLMERILLEAKALANADGGTVYLRTEDDLLCFEILRNDTLEIAVGGSTGATSDLPPIPLFHPDGGENHAHVAAHATHVGRSIHVEDAYEADGFDFDGTRKFDEQSGYRSKSFLTLPMKNQQGRVIGVLQLINARNEAGDIVPFAARHMAVAEALAAQAAVALDAQQQYEAQRHLLESFLQLLATAIDHKSPYTGGHCRRVPVLTEMIVRAMTEARNGPYAAFQLDEEQWYELHIAAWLHDCGKVTTPTHVMDKSTKLEGIRDGLDDVKTRFAVLAAAARARDDCAELEQLQSDLSFLESVNAGGEFMPEEAQVRVRAIAERRWIDARGDPQPVLTEEEVRNLCIQRGTLTPEERLIINGHMVQTVLMLEALPFPKNLRNVPEIACGHHERMDGRGYPKGLFAGDMSLPARAMAVADVFEALTASDRPYKPAMPLSQSMSIMGRMKVENHLDPELFDFFVSSGVYREYARRHLPPELCDEVDEAELLALKPKPLELPPEAERARRWKGFRPDYAHLVPAGAQRAVFLSGPIDSSADSPSEAS
ncbi:MAG: HD domain-containing phosphohydrolase [Myxococcota bacterium]